MIDEQRIGMDLEGSGSNLILGTLPVFACRNLRKPQENLSKYCLYTDRDSKPLPPRYKLAGS